MARAYGMERGLSEADIERRFFVHAGMPALGKPENAELVVKHAAKVDAWIVVFDTWSRAIIGLREIDDAVMKLSGEDGPIGRLLADGVTVVCIGHTALTDKTRLRGHSGPSDGAYQNVAVTGNKTGFKAEVQTLRGGKPERLRTVYAAVASGEVPVITWRSKTEHDKAVHDPRQEAEEPTAPVVVEAIEPSAAVLARPMTRAEKAAEKQRRYRENKKRTGSEMPPPPQFEEPAVW
jgi:hypothetical protein